MAEPDNTQSQRSVQYLERIDTVALEGRHRYEPATLADAYQLAEMLARSSIVPDALKNKPQDVLVVLMQGSELGLPPMLSLRQIHVIKGTPAMAADLMVGMVKADKKCEYFIRVASDDRSATYETKRAGDPEPQQLEYTLDDAKRAGLLGRDNWKNNTPAMLRARAKGALARDVYQDVLGGLMAIEEIEGEIIDAPKPTKASKLAERLKTAKAEKAGPTVEATAEVYEPAVKGERPAIESKEEVIAQQIDEAMPDAAPPEPAPETEAEPESVDEQPVAPLPEEAEPEPSDEEMPSISDDQIQQLFTAGKPMRIAGVYDVVHEAYGCDLDDLHPDDFEGALKRVTKAAAQQAKKQ